MKPRQALLAMALLLASHQAAGAAPRSPTPPPIPADKSGAVVSSAQLHQRIAVMKADLRPDTTLLWQPVLMADGHIAALEYWHRPRPPAVHITQAEYVTVVEGSGWMLSGGKLTNGREMHPGLIEGDEIEGGTRRELKPGDVFLIPAGMPHWFGIHGQGLVLLGIKLNPAPAK